MSVLGISCNVEKGRLLVRGVRFERGHAEQVFVHRATAGEDEGLQLRSLQNALSTRLADLDAHVAVIRTSDHFKGRGITDGVIRRMRAEGVALATLRSSIDRVQPMSGKNIGTACGSTKEDVAARAAELLPEAVDATAAALAANQLWEGED